MGIVGGSGISGLYFEKRNARVGSCCLRIALSLFVCNNKISYTQLDEDKMKIYKGNTMSKI